MIGKGFINFWRQDSGLKNMITQFDEMLVIAKDMFEKATTYIFDKRDNVENEMRELIKFDARLNSLQQSIRRDIVIHITVKGTKDILPCLLLMSLVKDAERLGDYAKNILEVAEKGGVIEKDKYHDILQTMRKNILKWFDDTKLSFDNCNDQQAKKTRENSFKSEKECDQIAWAMLKSDRKDAVALALLFRFFKRTAAHLGNICTSVTMPLDKLDYYEKEKND